MTGKRPTLIQIALSALLVGWALGIHLSFILAVPDPCFSPDSIGYTWPGLKGILENRFELNTGRTPMYPLFIYTALKIFGHFTGLVALQHLLALITGLIAGLTYYRYIRASGVGAAVVFFAVSALPIPAVYAHAILTENLYTFFLMLTVFFLLKTFAKSRTLNGFALGVCVAAAMLTRPVGYALLVAVIIVLAYRTRKGLGWQAALAGGIGGGAVLLALAVGGYSSSGFFGMNRFNGLALFGTTAPYLDPAGINDPKAQKILLPIYQKNPSSLSDFNWVAYAPEGPVQSLRRAFPPEQIDSLLNTLSWQAIGNKPLNVLSGQFRLLAGFFWDYSAIPAIYLTHEYTFLIYRGLHIYGAMAAGDSGRLRFLRHPPEEADTYFSRLRALESKTDEEAQKDLDQLVRDDVYRYGQVIRWWMPLTPFLKAMRWLPLLTFGASLLLWRFTTARAILLTLWLVILLHAGLSTLSGIEPRYAVPITPLYWILLIGGIEAGFAYLAKRSDQTAP